MKVYIVTQGEYSDYHIVAIFNNKDVANDFVKKMGSKINGYSRDFEIEEHELLNEINDYKTEKEYLEITYRSDRKEISFSNENNFYEDDFDDYKTIYFYDEGFYIAVMKQPLTVKNVLGAEKIMMDWIAQIEYELKHTFNGDLKAYKEDYKNKPF